LEGNIKVEKGLSITSVLYIKHGIV